MKKTLFLSAIFGTALCSTVLAETTDLSSIQAGDITVAGTAFKQITSVGDFAGLPEGTDATFIKGNGRYNIDGTTDLSNAGTIVLAKSKLGGSTEDTAAGQIFVDMWGKSGITIANDLILGETGYSEGATYSTALRLHESRETNKIVLQGQIQLAQDSKIAVNHEYNYIEGNISGAGKTLTLTDGGGSAVLHLSGGATLDTLTSAVDLALDATKADGETAAASKVYNIGTLNTTKNVTMGDGVQLNLTGDSTVKSISGGNTISVAEGTTFKATAQAIGTQSLQGGGNAEITLAASGNDTISANGLNKLSVIAATTTGHDTQITVQDFSGTLELTGRFKNESDFSDASKLVLHGSRGGNNTTGFWGTGAKTFTQLVELDGDNFVDFYASAAYTFSNTVSGSKMRTLNGSDVTFDGNVALANFTDNDNNVFFNAGTTITELHNNSNKNITFASGAAHVIDTISGTGSGTVKFDGEMSAGNNKTMTLTGSSKTLANDYVDLKANAHMVLSDHAELTAADAGSGKGIWINTNADISIKDEAKLKLEGLTITCADGAEKAVISRLDNGKTAKLGVNEASNKDFVKNTKVTDGDTTYSGTGTLRLGTLVNGKLEISNGGTVELSAIDTEIDVLNMSAGSIVTLGSVDSHTNTLKVTELTVNSTDNAATTLNANLDLTDTTKLTLNGALTMGCAVNLGDGGIELISSQLANLSEGDSITLFTGVDSVTFNSAAYNHTLYASEVFSNSDLQNTDTVKYLVSYNGSAITLSVVPEPATTTLSLLALAGLCARRRRH